MQTCSNIGNSISAVVNKKTPACSLKKCILKLPLGYNPTLIKNIWPFEMLGTPSLPVNLWTGIRRWPVARKVLHTGSRRLAFAETGRAVVYKDPIALLCNRIFGCVCPAVCTCIPIFNVCSFPLTGAQPIPLLPELMLFGDKPPSTRIPRNRAVNEMLFQCHRYKR